MKAVRRAPDSLIRAPTVLAEALLLHLVVKLGLRVMSYSRLRTFLERCPPVAARMRPSVPEIARTATAAARRLGGSSCLADAVVVHTMLRRRGYKSRLRIGVRHRGSSVAAHAWVECDGSVVVGELPEIAAYAVLA